MHYGFIFKEVGGGGGEGRGRERGKDDDSHLIRLLYMHHNCMTFMWKCEHWTQTDLPEVISSP